MSATTDATEILDGLGMTVGDVRHCLDCSVLLDRVDVSTTIDTEAGRVHKHQLVHEEPDFVLGDESPTVKWIAVNLHPDEGTIELASMDFSDWETVPVEDFGDDYSPVYARGDDGRREPVWSY